jgi:UMF1 family MFS transporter
MSTVASQPAIQDERTHRKVINAWSMYDWANSAFATTILAAILPVYYSQVAGSTLPGNLATVYWGYTVTIALLITAFLSPILGAIADYSGLKKKFLLTFAAIGILFTACLYFVQSGDWLLASLIFIISNVGFAGSDLFYNSFLPHIARDDEIDQVSTRGYALGYLGGGLLLGINVAMIQLMAEGELAARLSFVSVAIWWAIFTIPFIRYVQEPPVDSQTRGGGNPVVLGFQRLRTTFAEIKRYRQLLIFLLAFWIYNDGIGTIIKMATIYGAEIGIDQTALIGTLLMTQFVGIPFAFGFGWLAKRIGTKQSIYLGLAIYALISVAGYFMTTALHFWLLGFMVGTVQGGTQALSRSLFGAMSPRAKSAEFFGFYGMSSKFAGIVGPLLFAEVGRIAGSSRLSIVALIIFFIVGGAFLSQVDEAEGIRIARAEDAATS